MTKGLRYNTGKRKWSLVDYKALEPMVEVLEYGSNKYAPHNWRLGHNYTELTESLMRHLFAFLSGEDKDPESKLDHVGHIMCNAMFLSYATQNHPEMDDRYKSENTQLKQLELFE